MGEFYALAAAVVWGGAVILFRKSGETLSAFALNLFRVGVASVIFFMILLVMREPLLPDLPLEHYLRLIISGVIGIAISDTLLHRGLNLAGAGISAIAGCLYSPFVALFAFLLLDDRLRPIQLVGMALVVGGVLLTSQLDPPKGNSRKDVTKGIFWGIGSIGTVAISIVIAKPALDDSPVIYATALRQFASLAVMLPLAMLSPRRRHYFSAFKPVRAWRYSLTGTLLGSCIALLCWIAGMKYSQVGLAAILNQTATIWVLLFATLFLKEPMGVRKVLATASALTGILLVTLT